MPTEKMKYGLFKDDECLYVRVRTNERVLEHSSPYLERVEPDLYRVVDVSFETMQILRQLTDAYKQIAVYDEQYQTALTEWDSLVEKYGNDGILPPPFADKHFARTPSEKRDGLKGEDYYNGWQEKNEAWRQLNQVLNSRRNADGLLVPIRDYFQFKKSGI